MKLYTNKNHAFIINFTIFDLVFIFLHKYRKRVKKNHITNYFYNIISFHILIVPVISLPSINFPIIFITFSFI
jgi:hypothetical protein